MPEYILPNSHPKYCCGCIRLSFGCGIIGIFTALICIFEFYSTVNKFQGLLKRQQKCQDDLADEETEKEDLFYGDCSHVSVVQFILITEFIAFFMGFFSSLLLLIGICIRNPKLFIGWQIFIGTVIFSNFFTILFWHDALLVLEKIILLLALFYCFKVVKAFLAKISEDTTNEYPVVAVTIPEESNMTVFLPNHEPNISNEIKDDPPPPYPGSSLPIVYPSVSTEMQPPSYYTVIRNSSEPASLQASSLVTRDGTITSNQSISCEVLEGCSTLHSDPSGPTSELNTCNCASLPNYENTNDISSNYFPTQPHCPCKHTYSIMF